VPQLCHKKKKKEEEELLFLEVSNRAGLHGFRLMVKIIGAEKGNKNK
jgi:hypothetical protein